ncbi:MAG TPA: hypothetical protein VER96_41225 [Polyangiaceae bacterium]|nr:hypothetical protein [Polyangiaceae bacterium]
MKDEEIEKLSRRLRERWATQLFDHGDCRVEVLNEGGIKYMDPSRTVWVWGEVLTGDIAYLVESKSMHYWGDKTARVDDAVRREIVSKIEEAFKAHGLSIEIE